VIEQKLSPLTLQEIKDGVVIIDTDGCIRLANLVGQGYMALLADASLGSRLIYLGNRCLRDLLGPPPLGKTGHEVILAGTSHRVFEVMTEPVMIDVGTDGWLLIVREITPS